jgi:ABC-type proline/glycine betaine transport system ATPase subunit
MKFAPVGTSMRDIADDDLVMVANNKPQDNASPKIAVIVVMGVTGSGKSNFIRLATGSTDAVVGHDLTACK